MFCKNCSNKIENDSKFCSFCGEQITIEIFKETDVLEYSEKNNESEVISNSELLKNDKEDNNFIKKIFSGIGVGSAYIGGGLLFLVFSVLRFLYIAFAGLSMIWLAIILFQKGSIFLGLLALILGTPIAIGIASYLFIPLLLFSIVVLIIWGIISVLGFDISFYDVWDILWFAVKIIILGIIAFLGIGGFLESIKQKNIARFLKENWFYIPLFFFLVWIFL